MAGGVLLPRVVAGEQAGGQHATGEHHEPVAQAAGEDGVFLAALFVRVKRADEQCPPIDKQHPADGNFVLLLRCDQPVEIASEHLRVGERRFFGAVR